MDTFTCVVCGKTAEKRSPNAKGLVCGRSCLGKLGGTSQSKRVCPCGEPASKKGWCPGCSLERLRASKRRSYRRHREAVLAKKRARYLADPDKYRRATRDWADGRRFNGLRQERLVADDYTCQRCGGNEDILVHHRNRRMEPREVPDTTSTLEDLLTLCRSCHLAVHHEAGEVVGGARKG